MNDKAESKYQSEILQLTPISSLSEVIQQQLIRLSETIMIPGGNSLFEQGEYSERLFFMLSGEVELYQNNQLVKKISAGTDDAKTALNTSRAFSAVATARIVLLMVDRALLERLVILDSYVDKNVIAERAKWADQLLGSELIARLPAENLIHLFDNFDEISVEKDAQIITQDMPGKYFYIVREGRCVVSKHNYDTGDIITLAELDVGGYFGEEALLSGQKRTTSVTMVSDGQLQRMSRADYEKLLQSAEQTGLDYAEAAVKVREGAVWLDVRFEAEYLRSHIIGSINVPVAQVLELANKLSKEQSYLLYCDLGLRSPFMVNQLIASGYKVSYLKGGIQQYSRGINMSKTWVDNISERLIEEEPVAVGESTVSEAIQEQASVVNTSMGEQISAVDQRIRDLKSMLATENQLAQDWLENEAPPEDLGILIEARKKMEHIDSISAVPSHEEIAKQEGDSELGVLRKQLENAQNNIQKERARVSSNSESPEQKELTLKRVSDELEVIKNRLKKQESHELTRRESFEQQLATERTKMREQLARFSTGLELQQTRSLEIEEIRQTAALETKQIVETFKKAHAEYRARQQKTIQMVRLQLKKQAQTVIEKARKAQAEKAQALDSLRDVQKQLNDLRGQRASISSESEEPSDVPLLVNVESMTNEIDKAKEKFQVADDELSFAKSENQDHKETLEEISKSENSVRNDFLDWFMSSEQFNLDRDNLTSEQKLKLERVKKIAHEALEEAFNGTNPRSNDSGDQSFKNYK